MKCMQDTVQATEEIRGEESKSWVLESPAAQTDSGGMSGNKDKQHL